MKILVLAKYIYEDTLPEFKRNKTGFGLMVKDIIKSISSANQVLVITRVITKGKIFPTHEILRHTWRDIVKNISLNYLYLGVKEAIRSKEKLIDSLKIVYFFIDSKYVKEIINQHKPDIVHIHGIGESSKAYIKICDDLGIKYIVTLHGLIGIDKSVSASKYNKDIERDFLVQSERKGTHISVISSGVKARIIEHYGLKSGDNIRVILNGTDTDLKMSTEINIRKQYNIPANNYVVVCIGNLSERKNQIQVIESYMKIKKSIRDITSVLFIGEDKTNNTLINRVKYLLMEDNLIFCGFIKKLDISSYLEQADINVVASLDEGFGLSMIEGFVHGVPTVTFSDLDAIKDVYNKDAMLLVDNRRDESLAKSIEEALERKWDRMLIRKYSKNFSLNTMAKVYQEFYNDIYNGT